MTIMLIALLTSIAIAGGMWAFITHAQSKEAILNRIESVSSLTETEERLLAESKLDENIEEVVSLDDSFQDKLTRSLYLGGRRSKKDVRLFKALRIIPIIIPSMLILLQLSGGNMDQGAITKSIIAGVVAYLLIVSTLGSLKKKRQSQILSGMPQLFDLLVIALESGVNFSAALPRVLKEMDPHHPLTQEFDQMHHEFLAGLSFSETCDRLAKRCEVQNLSVIMNSLVESEQLGSSLSNVLRVQAHELRDKLRQRIREKAHRLPIKLLFPMMLIFSTLFVITLGPIGYKLTKSSAQIIKKSKAVESASVLNKKNDEKPKKAPRKRS